MPLEAPVRTIVCSATGFKRKLISHPPSVVAGASRDGTQPNEPRKGLPYRSPFTPTRCDLSCQLPITPGGWRRKAREGRSASRREDPIHLGAATRQRGGAI